MGADTRSEEETVEHMRPGLVGELRGVCRLCAAEVTGWKYDLPPSLILLLDDYLAGRGDDRECADALARLTPNQVTAVRLYAADRGSEGGAAAERVAVMLDSLVAEPTTARSRAERGEKRR